MISIIFLVVFLLSLLFAVILEINYLKIKDDLINTVKIYETTCLVNNKKSEERGNVDHPYYLYYLYINFDKNNYKIKISSDEFYHGNYFIGNNYSFYMEDGKEFYTTKDKLLNSYNPVILFVF